MTTFAYSTIKITGDVEPRVTLSSSSRLVLVEFGDIYMSIDSTAEADKFRKAFERAFDLLYEAEVAALEPGGLIAAVEGDPA